MAGGKVRDVDASIAPLVKALNEAGIVTVASCSGHGYQPGSIALADGLELLIAPDYETARQIEGHFPGINGEPPRASATNFSERLGLAIKMSRSSLKLSLQNVADRAGMSKAHVWELEQGRAVNPTVSSLFAISRAIGVSVSELLGEDVTTPRLHPVARRLALDADAALRRAAEDIPR